jgi:hypothetical protein
MRPLRRRWVMFAALALVAAVSLGACGTGELDLSLKPGDVSDCYRGLPAARAALHDDDAKLEGVHRITIDHVLRFLPGVTAPGTSLPVKSSGTEVCTFAFEGHFSRGQVTGAPPLAEGPVAIIVISSDDLKLVASYVGQALPHRFSRRVASPHLVHLVLGSPPTNPSSRAGAKAAVGHTGAGVRPAS